MNFTTFSYPHLGHPTDHFNITPFEAIYCDIQTYEHILMQGLIDKDHLDDNYLVYLRDFILDEVEADIVCLQNKTIGKNHTQTDPAYKYKAWYKAYDKILIGNKVTPKTDSAIILLKKQGSQIKSVENFIFQFKFNTETLETFYRFPPYTNPKLPLNL